MQSDDTLRDILAGRRRFLRLLALMGLGIGAAGVVPSAAEAATRIKKKVEKARVVKLRRASRPERVTQKQARLIDQYETPSYAEDRFEFVSPDEKTLSLIAPTTGVSTKGTNWYLNEDLDSTENDYATISASGLLTAKSGLTVRRMWRMRRCSVR